LIGGGGWGKDKKRVRHVKGSQAFRGGKHAVNVAPPREGRYLHVRLGREGEE